MEEENKNDEQKIEQEEKVELTNVEAKVQHKNNKIFVIILCIILFVAGIGVGLLVTNLFSGKSDVKDKKEEPIENENKNDKEQQDINDNKNENKEKEEIGEKNITSQETINLLSTKYNKLFGDYINIRGQNDPASLFGRYLEWRATFNELKDPPQDEENRYAYYVGELPFDTVNKEYFDLFGINIDKNETFQGSCATTKYNADRDSFIIRKNGCDAGWGWFVRNYNYKYTEDNNNAYIYTAIAVYSGIEEVTILTDEDLKKEYTTVKSTEDFTLDETNYQKFAKYKITFKKDENDYHFVKIEKIEDGV